MKHLTLHIKDTNLGKIQAYAVAKSSESYPAKECIDTQFNIKGYVLADTETQDDETGEVTQGTSLSMLTTDEHIIGTNSTTIINNLKELIDMVNDDETLKLEDVTCKIAAGKAKSGNTFYSLDVVI